MTRRLTISDDWKKQLKRLPWLLLIPLGLLMPRIATSFPYVIERYYSSSVYPVVSGAINAFSGIFKFSLCEFLLYALVIGVLLSIFIPISLTIARKLKPVKLIAIFITLLIIVGIVLNVFYFVWGFNYSRPSLYELMELKKEFHPVKSLERLCIQLTNKANELRPQLKENEKGVFVLSEGNDSCFEALPLAYDELGKEIALFGRQRAAKAKPVAYSSGLSAMGIAGIYVPFTAEPNINIDQPALLIPSSAAHEMAHYLGFAREDEANFISFIACMESDNNDIRYSGVMLALITCTNELYSCDKAAYSRLRDRFSDAIRRDISDYNAYWEAFESPVRETATKINDNYLKSNMQSTGVKSYNLMVDLLLAYYTDFPKL